MVIISVLYVAYAPAAAVQGADPAGIYRLNAEKYYQLKELALRRKRRVTLAPEWRPFSNLKKLLDVAREMLKRLL